MIEFDAEYKGKPRNVLPVTHGLEALNNFKHLFWFRCFVDLFYRGDCAERDPRRTKAIGGRRWAKCLLTRVDFRGWRMSIDFVASLYNILMRRDQMLAVHWVITGNPFFQQDADLLKDISAKDFATAALACGECSTVRQMLRKDGVDLKVKTVLRQMKIVQGMVEGSDEERLNMRHKFVALRIWNGFSSIFFTLNPADTHSALTVTFCNADHFHIEKISLELG